jgi:predicted transcriptional regulator
LNSLLVQGRNRNNNGNHRGRLDIIADILQASYGGTRKTYFMYRCNLSFRQCKSYLDFLTNKGFICIGDGKRNQDTTIFEITDKGKQFLRAYSGLMDLMT